MEKILRESNEDYCFENFEKHIDSKIQDRIAFLMQEAAFNRKIYIRDLNDYQSVAKLFKSNNIELSFCSSETVSTYQFTHEGKPISSLLSVKYNWDLNFEELGNKFSANFSIDLEMTPLCLETVKQL